MKKLHLFLIFMLAAVIGISSCSKEGPQGPAGPQGEQGIQGDKGDKGNKGDKGTANVIYSEWMDPEWNLTNSSKYKTMRVTENRLTDDFNESGGMVLTFFRFQDNVVFQMPYTQHNDNNERYGYAVYFRDHGEVRFIVQSTDGSALTHDEIMGTGIGVSLQFKYVLILGGVHARRNTSLPDFSDYHAVCEYYGIPE